MILEGIVTTGNRDGQLNVAPMGPIVNSEMTALHFRPFKTSQTYRNLKRHPEGVFHVVDDVLLLAESAIGRLKETPPVFPAKIVDGQVLEAACRWYEFRIDKFDDREERTNLYATVVHAGRLRDFFGFNRAKHAVLEAAILATRVGILPGSEIRRQFETLKSAVEKTAGDREREAFLMLETFVQEHSSS